MAGPSSCRRAHEDSGKDGRSTRTGHAVDAVEVDWHGAPPDRRRHRATASGRFGPRCPHAVAWVSEESSLAGAPQRRGPGLHVPTSSRARRPNRGNPPRSSRLCSPRRSPAGNAPRWPPGGQSRGSRPGRRSRHGSPTLGYPGSPAGSACCPSPPSPPKGSTDSSIPPIRRARSRSARTCTSGFDELMPKTLATATATVDGLPHPAHVSQTSGGKHAAHPSTLRPGDEPL